MARQTKAKDLNDKIRMRGMATHDAAVVVLELQTDKADLTFTASGSAKRSSNDRFVRGVGETLATARALENLARKLRKEIRSWVDSTQG